MTRNIETVIKKQITTLLDKAMDLTIRSDKDMGEATELLSKMNTVMDKVKEEKDKVLVPLNAAAKAEKLRWKPIEDAYMKVIEPLRVQMSMYQTEKVRLQKEEEAKIANRVGEGKGKLKIETAVKQIEAIDDVIEVIKTDEGMVKFREKEQVKILNNGLIPREYMEPNMRKILFDLQNGVKIEGCELEILQVPVNYR